MAEFDQGCALAAFVLRGFGDGGYVGVRLQEVADAAAEDAGAVAVNDADAGRPARKARSRYFSNSSVASSTVRPMRLISMRMSSVLALVTVTWTSFCWRAAASGSEPIGSGSIRGFDDFGNVVAFYAHLDGAEGDFEEILLDFALYDGDFIH